jgi:hypothetical protein
MTDTPEQPAAEEGGETGAAGEMAPDRPTEDPEDVGTDVQQEEAKEQSGI